MKHLLMAILTASLLSACSNTDLATKQIDNAAIKQASETNITPEEAVKNARSALVKANNDRLAYFTPLHFKNVEASLVKIEALQKEQLAAKNSDKNLMIITEAFKTQKLISDAYQAKTTIESLLSESLSHKSVLDELGAKKEFPKVYNHVNEDLSDLFKLVEQNKIARAQKDQVDVLEDMIELEVDTLVNIYVKPAKFILDKAEDFDADKYAETTFEQAELAIKRAEDFIAANSRKIEEVKQVGEEAVLAAKRALNTGKFAKTLVELDEERAEIKTLEMEAMLENIIRGFSAQGLQGLTLQEQSQELAQLARTQANKIQALNIQITANNASAENSTEGTVQSNEADSSSVETNIDALVQ